VPATAIKAFSAIRMNCLPVVTSSFLQWKAAQASVAPVYSFAKNTIAARAVR
jgi:hypothetical protein